MRTIKFRGKSIDGEEWLYGDLVRSSDIERCAILVNDRASYDECEVIPTTIGQFTGLCDSMGNQIYDGDILSIVRGHITFTAIVKWNDKEASFGLIINGSDEINKTPLGSWLLFGQCEIIGNIYDNEQ